MNLDAVPEANKRSPGRFRFLKAYRLRLASEFDEAFRQDQSAAGRLLIVRIRQGEGADRRLGAVAGKRTFRRAVDRSRAKRLMREAFRLSRDRLSPGVDYVLIARRQILKARRDDVSRDLERVAARLSLLQPADRSK